MPPKVLKENVTQLDDKKNVRLTTKTKIEKAYVRKQVTPDEAANKIGKAVRSTVKLDAKKTGSAHGQKVLTVTVKPSFVGAHQATNIESLICKSYKKHYKKYQQVTNIEYMLT